MCSSPWYLTQTSIVVCCCSKIRLDYPGSIHGTADTGQIHEGHVASQSTSSSDQSETTSYVPSTAVLYIPFPLIFLLQSLVYPPHSQPISDSLHHIAGSLTPFAIPNFTPQTHTMGLHPEEACGAVGVFNCIFIVVILGQAGQTPHKCDFKKMCFHLNQYCDCIDYTGHDIPPEAAKAVVARDVQQSAYRAGRFARALLAGEGQLSEHPAWRLAIVLAVFLLVCLFIVSNSRGTKIFFHPLTCG